MKISYFFILAFAAILSFMADINSFAQEKVLVSEHKKSHRQNVIGGVGRTVRYKIPGSKHFEKGMISGISDSTVSFENIKSGTVTTVPFRNIEALRIPRSTGRKVVSWTLGIVSSLALARWFAESNSHDPTYSPFTAFLIVPIEIVIVAAPVVLAYEVASPKEVDFSRKSVLKAVNAKEGVH